MTDVLGYHDEKWCIECFYFYSTCSGMYWSAPNCVGLNNYWPVLQSMTVINETLTVSDAPNCGINYYRN